MSRERRRSLLAAWLLLLVGVVPLAAEEVQMAAPLGPVGYGGPPRGNEGLFFRMDGLVWHVKAPDLTTVGVPVTAENAQSVFVGEPPNDPVISNEPTVTQQSSLDTSWIPNQFIGGMRIEFGNIYGHQGWDFQWLRLSALSIDYTTDQVQMFFDDQVTGAGGFHHLDGFTTSDLDPANIRRLYVQFDTMRVDNTTKPWGVDLNYIYRTHPGRHGFIWTWFFGARYFEFQEEFTAEGTGGLLGAMRFSADAYNQIIGPQIGLRAEKDFATRWSIAAEGRFTAGLNNQSVRLDGTMATGLDSVSFPRAELEPLAIRSLQFTHVAHLREFTPLLEYRLEARYQVSQAIGGRIGYSGIWMENIARPSDMIQYQLAETQTLGIRTENNTQYVLMHGFTAGIDINY